MTVAILLAAALVGCGGGGTNNNAKTGESTPATTAAPTDAAATDPAGTNNGANTAGDPAKSSNPCEVLPAADLQSFLGGMSTDDVKVSAKLLFKGTCDYTIAFADGEGFINLTIGAAGLLDDDVKAEKSGAITVTDLDGLGDRAVAYDENNGNNVEAVRGDTTVKLLAAFDLASDLGISKGINEVLSELAQQVFGRI